MNELLKVLNSDFKISKIIIDNFTILDKDLLITIKLNTGDLTKVITFNKVKGIEINPEFYTSSNTSAIIIDDISQAQLENVNFKISISENAMSFYCKSISLI